ncbi:MAG: hypothetical protein WAQ08_16065 [Aquabacterium sp.]|uniref:hypothetical protein n=1 Tax=Aquabacterium sp. TaxID=1872578 RepID=UPI003BB1317E
MGLLMLWPLVMGVLLWLLVIYLPARQLRAWRDDPARPWNITMRLTRENIARAEAEYLAKYQPVPKERRRP